jgi:hypothetical protein
VCVTLLTKISQACRSGKGRQVSTLSHDQLSRKRAHDRNSQRAARQRNKSYIESLEERLQELLNTSTAETESQLATEIQRNSDLTRQVAVLKSKVQSALGTCNPFPENGLVGVLDLPGSSYPFSSDMSTINMSALTYGRPLEFRSVSYTETPDMSLNSGSLAAPNAPIHFPATRGTWAMPSSTVDQPSHYLGVLPEQIGHQTIETTTPNDKMAVTEWQLVNEVFKSADHATRASVPLVDNKIPWHNICIRALVEGWESIDHIVGHIPIWQQLRSVDEIICKGFRDVEKLAAMYVMYLRLNYLSNPSSENKALVPQWYLHR